MHVFYKVALRDARHSTEQAAFLLGAPKPGSFLSLGAAKSRPNGVKVAFRRLQ